jgi:L-arabinokinase
MIGAYISGHGFGHSTRTAEVLRVVRARAPRLPIAVTTSAPSFLYEGTIAPPLGVRAVECDIGLVQRGALVIDETATAERWRAFAAGWDDLVRAEAAWMRAVGVRLVLGDIPPLAFAAAAEAGVRSVALGNFSWDWIYQHLAAREPALGEAASVARAAYGAAELLLRLPFAGDLGAFARIEDLPLVARRPRVERDDARKRLGLREGPTVLLSFGGMGLPGLRPEAYGSLSDYRFLVTGASGDGPLPPNMRRLAGDELDDAGLDYPDLVGAIDVVVTKPGYGIVTDCIGAGTRVVYTDRGDFPEYPILARGLEEHLPAAFASNDDVRNGRLGDALESVLSRPVPPTPDLSGAERAAERLLELAGIEAG